MNARLSAVLFGSAAAGVALLALLDAAAKGFVLLAVACAVALAMRRAAASARHLVWLAALACALVLPVCSWALPGWRVLPAWMRWETVQTAVPSQNGTDGTHRTYALPPVASAPSVPFVASVPSAPSIARPAPRNFRISASALLAIWAAGSALLLAPLVWSVFALARVSRRASTGKGHVAVQVAAIADELGLRRSIRILLGDADAMPMVWGIFRAHLLLPSSAADWPEARLRSVLLHELAHLRRRDPLALLVAQLALALHWFNPLAWFAVHRLRAEQERACDDFVLRHGIRPSEYATDLLAVATGLRAQSFAAAALTMAHPARLEGRIVGILDAARNRATLTRWLIASTVLLATAIALPLAMLRAAEEKTPAIANEKPHIISASIVDQQLNLEISTGPVPLLFRIGGVRTEGRFTHRVSENAQRSLRITVTPDPGSIWERLEIRCLGRAPYRLPLLRPGFLPEGEWAWRATVTRDEGRFTFADVVLADGRKLPVSVEVGAVPDPEEVPFMRVSGLLDCEFRFYGVADGSLKDSTKIKLADAGKLVAGTATTLENLINGNGPVNAPRFSTRFGQRAVIEIIREYRHEVKPGEFSTDNLGTTCEIEAERLDQGMMMQGKVSLALYGGQYASLDEAIAKAMSKEATAVKTAKVRRLEREFSTMLAEDEALVVPLPSEGMFPGAAVAVVTLKQINPDDGQRSHWQPKSERAKNRVPIESWLVTVPASARAETESVLPNFSSGIGLLDDEKFQALQACAAKNTAMKIEQLQTVIAQPEEAVVLERSDVRLEFKAEQTRGDPNVELEIIAPMALPSGGRKISTLFALLPGSRMSFPYLPTDDGSPQRVLLIRPKPPTEPASK